MQRLDNKIALVTGGYSGIGAASVRLFAEEGAVVVFVGRSESKGIAYEKELVNDGLNVHFYKCDVADKHELAGLKEYIEDSFGRLDILFNNAGVLITCSLEEIDNSIWEKVYKTNVEAVMNMTKIFMPLLEKTNGNIVNNASVAGMHSHTEGRKAYLYASSKAALIQFSKLCALNYAPNVRVNCICPGIIDTPIYTNRDYSRFSGIPMGRVGTVDEVANVVLFLASSEASYLTGLVMPIDGGSALV